MPDHVASRMPPSSATGKSELLFRVGYIQACLTAVCKKLVLVWRCKENTWLILHIDCAYAGRQFRSKPNEHQYEH